MTLQKIIHQRELKHRVYTAKSPIHGVGLFAKQYFSKSQYIGSYHGPKAARNGTYVLWIYEDEENPIGYSGKNLLRYLNHQQDCNAEFDGLDLYCRKDIQPNEEITFDYGWDE